MVTPEPVLQIRGTIGRSVTNLLDPIPAVGAEVTAVVRLRVDAVRVSQFDGVTVEASVCTCEEAP